MLALCYIGDQSRVSSSHHLILKKKKLLINAIQSMWEMKRSNRKMLNLKVMVDGDMRVPKTVSFLEWAAWESKWGESNQFSIHTLIHYPINSLFTSPRSGHGGSRPSRVFQTFLLIKAPPGGSRGISILDGKYNPSSELYLQSLRLSPDTLQRNLISAAFTRSHIPLVHTQSSWP